MLGSQATGPQRCSVKPAQSPSNGRALLKGAFVKPQVRAAYLGVPLPAVDSPRALGQSLDEFDSAMSAACRCHCASLKAEVLLDDSSLLHRRPKCYADLSYRAR